MTGRMDIPAGNAAASVPVTLDMKAEAEELSAVVPAFAPVPRPPATAAIRQILLHVTPDHHPGQQLAVGVEVAARFDARLVGFYPIRRTVAVRRMLASSGAERGEARTGAGPLRNMADVARTTVLGRMLTPFAPVVAAAVEAERAKARTAFDRLCRMAEAARVDVEWHAVGGDPGALLAGVGRFHDLIVTPAADPDYDDTRADTPRRAALRSGRPVLVVPRQWASPGVGRRVLVLWNGTREAAFATRAALPFLVTAERVTVLAVPDRLPLDIDGGPLFSVGDFLWSHGVVASLVPFEPNLERANPAKAVLDLAEANEANLVVSGAFGPWPSQFSPVRGWRLANFTRALLSETRTPLLLCH